MIISKTPMRMSYVCGGSDMSNYYREEIGAVVSTTIDKFMYLVVNRKFDGDIRLSYAKTEIVATRSEIKHPLVREALEMTGIDGGIEIASLADIPSQGSGLGSSSAYTVGLLNALYAYKGSYASKKTLAEQACEIEIIKCKEPIGKQDQYAAAFGGLNFIRFHSNEAVSVEPVVCRPETFMELQENTLVFFTGRTRSASVVLKDQSAALLEKNKKLLMNRMVELAFDLKVELESNSLINIGNILDENWRLKSQLTQGITDNEIDEWYSLGIRSGAAGGKLLGAGNGGFLMFFAPRERHASIKAALPKLRPVTFNFDQSGTQIVFYQPTQG
jgi:D-glycero-alpha-D-manno-heptose-7-phosphate kinase